MTVTLTDLAGAQIRPHLDTIAQLRMTVFRDFPYLYEGSLEYERNYLETYAQSPGSLFVLARDQDRVVGAATGIPMADETDAFKQPFVDQGWQPEEIFYFGESVLLPDYRGQGIGVGFFDHREAYALSKGFRYAVFCAVVRPEDHPMRPADYQPLDRFWQNRGYRPLPELTTEYAWTDVGDSKQSHKTMQFWYREL